MTQRNTTSLLTALIAAILAASCGGDDPVEPMTPTTVAVSQTSATFESLEETVQLTATVKNQHGQVMSGVAVTWTSSAPATATVDTSGLVTAVANGTAAVTATAGSASGTAAITVAQVPVGVAIAPDSLDFAAIDDTARVEATFVDANGHALADAGAEWVSADPAVATVDASGLVTAVGNGAAAVTATAGSVSGTSAVTVDQVPVGVAIVPATVNLGAIGDTVRVGAAFVDANGHALADAGAEWASADPAVATVDTSGLVTAVANGTAAVTATAGEVSGTASVTVDQVAAKVVVDPATDTLMTSGDTLRLWADALDSNGNAVAGAVFAWASTDTLVAVVDDEGLVTGVSAGEVEVTATSEGSTGRARLTVAAPVPTTVAISPDTVAFSALGQTARLAAEVRDQVGRVMEGEPVAWSSGDTLVATVDSAGLVTAMRTGATTVGATAGSASATAVVTVTQSAGRVVVSPPAATIALGDTLRLTAEAFDENGYAVADAEFDWTSSDLSVAQVDGQGLVTGVAEGRTTVTAVADGARAASEITVENPDRAALVAFYNATDGPNWVDNTNWLTDAPLGEWYGVTTDASGRVVGIRLMGRWDGGWVPHGLSGAIPPELGSLSNLTSLVLSHNALSGVIPPELGELSNLRRLELSENYLSGEIPGEMGKLLNLGFLGLRSNNLTGVVPGEIRGLANLWALDLNENSLTGQIPTWLRELSNLKSLYLGGNNLTGEIPAWLGELSSLVQLHLGGNNLTGEIPPELASLANLRDLYLYGNALTGKIPSELGGLSNLRHLLLGDNDGILGPIPFELGRLENLEALGLGGTDLGALPITFVNLHITRIFQECDNDNGICAPGTSEFAVWREGLEDGDRLAFCNAADHATLTHFYELTGGGGWTDSEGWLSGPGLKEWHGVEADSLGRVTALDLSHNGLSGSLPAGIANFSELTSLRIDGNDLGGRLPLGLTALDLDEFHYDGTDLCEPNDAEFRSWLEGIPSHRGTSRQCPPLTEREALAALYESMGGPSWRKNGGWLTGARLGSWHGVSVDAQGQVVGLNLSWNNLSGTLPPELGGLSNLRWLHLGGGSLSGEIPEWLVGLSNLRRLTISYNDFSGEIPAWLGQLPNLISLDLRSNDLTGTIPPELGGLTNMRSLDLGSNELAGGIPAQLDGLSNLVFLNLSYNDLSGSIPPELGNLSSLRYLFLHSNDLSGAIPPELGNLADLERMLSGQNDLSGPIPPTFGGLASLIELELSHNPGLAGAIPAGMSDLALESLIASGTNLCVPREPAFEEWLATIPRRRIAVCGEPPAAYLVQAVQSRAHPVPLVAGEDALLRVFVTGAMETAEGIPEVRARFFLNGAARHVVDIPRSPTPIPTEVDEGDLAMSANAEIPGHLVRPGLEMVVEIDPGGVLDASLGVPRRIPQDGRLAVEVREMPVLDLTVIPFLWRSDPDSAIIGLVEGMAADPEGHALLEDTHVLLPVGDIDVTARAPVASTSNSVFDLLAQTEAIRVLEGGGGHYKGMMSGGFAVWGGVAHLGGRSSVSGPNSGTIAHELGHNMGLRHAPCGGAGGPDPSFPYPDGTIGAWGYDFRSGLLVSAARRDHMTYCDPTWTSDYHFTNALSHRLSDEGASAAALAASPARSLLLWGGVDTTGTPFLNPAFVAAAPPTLPDSAGAYTVTGRDARGGELFSLNFTMPEVADGDGGSSFVFALPVRQEWEANLATVTLSGPNGTVTLDGDTDNPMAILRDPVTGQVRGFLRDLPPQTQAAMDAAERAIEPGLQVLFSRGIPDPTEWRR